MNPAHFVHNYDMDDFLNSKTNSKNSKRKASSQLVPQISKNCRNIAINNNAAKKPESIVLIDSDSEEGQDSDSSFSSSDSAILQFEKVRVTKQDYDSLLNKNVWLNDNLIDFYMQYLKKNHDKRNRIYLFNSMFFMKLQRIQRSENTAKEYYNETKAWFKDKSVNEKRIWLIPVCEGKHWYIIAISNPVSTRPVVFVFDSLSKRRRSRYSAIDLVKGFLIQKYKAERSGKFRRFEVHRVKLPQQKNNNDCGLFALRTAEMIFELNQTYMKVLRGEGAIDENHEIYKHFPILTRTKVRKTINDCIKNQL